MKKIGLLVTIFIIGLQVLNAQNFRTEGVIDIKLFRTFDENFRVKNYEVTSGKIALAQHVGESRNLITGKNIYGGGLNGMFLNYGDYGTFRIEQISPFRGMAGRFMFEEKINGVWTDAAELFINLPLVGSNEISLNYFSGFSEFNGFQKTPHPQLMRMSNSVKYGDGPKQEKIISGVGFNLYDEESSGDIRFRRTRYTLVIDVNKREWMNKSINLPTTGSTTLLGKIKLNPNNMMPAQGITFENAIRNTIKINANAYTKAQWIKIDERNSTVQLQNKKGWTVELYDFDVIKYEIKYRIKDLPNFILGQKYYNDKLDMANSKSSYKEDYSGNYLYVDDERKDDKKVFEKIYLWLTYSINSDSKQYWQAGLANTAPQVEKAFIDLNNIKNEIPQLEIVAYADGDLTNINLKNTEIYDNGNIEYSSASFNIQGIWSISNATDGFIIDPNFSTIQDKIAPVINPAEINIQVQNEVQNKAQQTNTLKDTRLNRNVKQQVQTINKSQIKTRF